MRKITIATVFMLVVGLALTATGSVHVQAQNSGCTVDLSAVTDLLNKAKASYSAGDMTSGDTDFAQARTMLGTLQSQCAGKASMATCDYRFDATIREGTHAGTDLNGNLVLIQNSDKAVSGYVIPNGYKATAKLNSSTDLAKPPQGTIRPAIVPVDGDLDGLKITLRFTLPDNGGTITGTGTMDAPISACAGTMLGSAQGPDKTDTGDWLGGAALSGCISAGVHSCVVKYGANGSGQCAAEQIAICQASPNR